MATPIVPGDWLGLLGGGQLGRMFAMAAQSLGFRVAVLDPAVDGPAAAVADRHIHADYLDAAGLARLAATVRAATTEFENVPATALEFLARDCRVTPAAASVAIAQDRIREKTFLAAHGIALAPFAVLRTRDDAQRVRGELLPGIVKSARMGYDGKGQRRVGEPAAVAAAFDALGGVPCVLERFVDLACEVSVIVARREGGDARTWPVAENQHRDGILDVSIVPARIDEALAARARDMALAIAEALDYRGVLCVELFVTADGGLLINEIAPRPHNSGHYTIDA
ncbi:MAG: 5-(carboxyamino)imidazole ribonucleotide synthase, partial [Burkholderiales bacterium]